MFGRGKKRRRVQNEYRSSSRDGLLHVNGRSGDKRDRTHKTGALVLLLLAVAGIGWAAVAGTEMLGRSLFSGNDNYTIRVLDIRSDGSLRPENLREYAKVMEGQNLFEVDLAQVKKNLESAPRIRTAEVRRDLPDTLIIRVTERTALGRLADGPGGLPVLVDRDGYVLGLGRQSNLPLIRGAAEKGLGPGSVVREKHVLDALDVLELCDSTRLGSVIHLQTIEVNRPDYLVLNLAGGEVIQLGRDQLKERLEKLVDLLKTNQEMGRLIKSVDLTVLRNIPVAYRTP